jgi:hypothetical protein
MDGLTPRRSSTKHLGRRTTNSGVLARSMARSLTTSAATPWRRLAKQPTSYRPTARLLLPDQARKHKEKITQPVQIRQ